MRFPNETCPSARLYRQNNKLSVVLSITFSDTYNNNLGLSVAKTSWWTYIDRTQLPLLDYIAVGFIVATFSIVT